MIYILLKQIDFLTLWTQYKDMLIPDSNSLYENQILKKFENKTSSIYIKKFTLK